MDEVVGERTEGPAPTGTGGLEANGEPPATQDEIRQVLKEEYGREPTDKEVNDAMNTLEGTTNAEEIAKSGPPTDEELREIWKEENSG